MTAGSYHLEPERPELGAPVLIHAMTGFMDAGGAARLAVEHLLENCQPTRVVQTVRIPSWENQAISVHRCDTISSRPPRMPRTTTVKASGEGRPGGR